MMFDCDLHLHGRFSMGTSRRMSVQDLADEAKRKGLHLLGSGDILHPEWRGEFLASSRVRSPGVYEVDGVPFVCTAEVEDSRRVHHLVLFPDVDAAVEFAVMFDERPLRADGRPRVPLTGEKVAALCEKVGALIGPAHAFTPWRSMYAHHDTLRACYDGMSEYISFVELGLSADSTYADRIDELRPLVFLTCSDAHSPRRIAREFTRIRVDGALTFDALKRALSRGSDAVVLNAGLYPQEGKYNESACVRCHRHFTRASASGSGWRCGCGGRIKKGVVDRVHELAGRNGPVHPPHRGRYIHLVPLETLVALGMGKRPTSAAVRRCVEQMLAAFGTELNALLNVRPEEARDVTGVEGVERAFRAFRTGRLRLIPGGGGSYGEIVLQDMNRGHPG